MVQGNSNGPQLDVRNYTTVEGRGCQREGLAYQKSNIKDLMTIVSEIEYGAYGDLIMMLGSSIFYLLLKGYYMTVITVSWGP